MIRQVAVLVPARDEAARINGCLQALLIARERCPVAVSITVVADSCQDETALIARRFAGVHVIEIDSENVGVARGTAVEHALSEIQIPSESVWLANTDADSFAPSNWLSSQVACANSGYDVIIGTVRPDPREYPRERQAVWEATHANGQAIGNIYGANLGVRASAYLEVGGYMPFPEHEDVDLVGRLSGFRQIATDEAEVITSARLYGRTPGGYAAYLREELEAESLSCASPARSLPGGNLAENLSETCP